LDLSEPISAEQMKELQFDLSDYISAKQISDMSET